MSLKKLTFSAMLLALVMQSCEEEYIPNTLESDQQYVVEGFIEAGEGSLPAYVFLTRSIPFISTISPDIFNTLFVRDAEITVSDGENLVRLTELCLGDLPPEFREQVGNLLGIDADSTNTNICAYVDIFNQLIRAEGRKYDLVVKVEGKELKATTTIPRFVPLTNFKWMDPPGEPSDTLAQLLVTINDPPNEKNFYRYMTATQGQRLIPSPFNSSVDDAIFDGKEFEFPLAKAENLRRRQQQDPNAFGLYRRDDTVTIKWMNIDEYHFKFWRTRDRAASSGGSPFSSFVRIAGNVDGALGIWGGYAVGVYTIYLPPK